MMTAIWRGTADVAGTDCVELEKIANQCSMLKNKTLMP
jgi:hypothetical protein